MPKKSDDDGTTIKTVPPVDSGWPERQMEGVKMLDEPQVAPDGHVNLSQEDIDSRG